MDQNLSTSKSSESLQLDKEDLNDDLITESDDPELESFLNQKQLQPKPTDVDPLKENDLNLDESTYSLDFSDSDEEQEKSFGLEIDNPNEKKISAREYQKALFERAKKENSIIFLGTGKGKTLVSIMIIQNMIKNNPEKKVVFVANTLQLVEQQKSQIEKYMRNLDEWTEIIKELEKLNPYEAHSYIMTLHSETETSKDRINNMKKAKILVTTAQSFLNKLRHNDLALSKVGLLVFDECHHTHGSHPYNMIMQEFYFTLPKEDRPQILGLTASPVLNLNESNNAYNFTTDLEAQFYKLYEESNLDSKFVVLSKEEEEESDKIEGVGDSIDIIASYGNDNSEEDMLKLCHTDNFHNFFQYECFIDKFKPYINLKEDKITHPILLQYYNYVRDFVTKTAIIILLELGYETVGIAFKELHENTQTISSEMTRLIEFDETQVKIFRNLEKYIAEMAGYILQQKPHPTHTKKIIKLKGIIREQIKVADQKILVFCQMKVITRYLCDYLNRMESDEERSIKAGYIIGKGKMANNTGDKNDDDTVNVAQLHGYVDIYRVSEEIKFEQESIKPENLSSNANKIRTKIKQNFDNESMNLEGQINAVKEFRDNKINILVATGVVEEGFDIPSCNVVISYDELLNIKQYIQIKGRARMKNSHFYIFAHESRENNWASNFKLYLEALKYLKNLARNPKPKKAIAEEKPKSLKPADLLKKNRVKDPNANFGEKIEDYKSFITSEGCLLNTDWSVDLFSHFCMKINTKPIFRYYQVLGLGYICCIILPIELAKNTRMVCGTLGNTKDSAKKLATFAYCKKLYHNKMLNEKLKVTNFVIKGYKVNAKFNYPQDSKFNENLKKLGSDPKNKDLLYVPVTSHDPFIGQYTQEGDKFVGYIYSVKFFDIILPENSGADLETSPLAFVYFNENLSDANFVCKTNEQQFKVNFKLVDRLEFTVQEYERYLKHSRFYDATVRGWDINFFEMVTGKYSEEKSIAYSAKKKLVDAIRFAEFLNDGKPIYPFLLVLNEDGEPDTELASTMDIYIEKTTKRFLELSIPENNKNVTFDEDFAAKFKTDEKFKNRKIVQMWSCLRKFYVKEISSLDQKLADNDLELFEKMLFESDNHSQNPDDYALKCVSLREHMENLQKGKIKEGDGKSFFYYEMTDYPLNVQLLLHIMLFKSGLESIKSYLRTLYFKEERLYKIEEESKSLQKTTLTFQAGDLKQYFKDDELTQIFSNYSYRSPVIPYRPIPENSETEVQVIPFERKDYSNTNLTQSIPVNNILKALKTSQYDYMDNYDRLEFLGDTVLKFLSTIQVFSENPEADEDGLHLARTQIICNFGLLRISVKHEIHEFILGKVENVLPISFEEAKKPGEGQQSDANDPILSKDDLKEKNMQQFHKKILADVVESLTGTYYLHFGLEGCQKFLNFIQVLAYPSLYIDIKYDLSRLDFSNVKYVVHLQNELTKIFGGKYQIKNMNYFIQAFTHSTFRKTYLNVYSEKCDFIIKIADMDGENAEKEQTSNLNQEGELEKRVKQQAEEMNKIDSNLSYERLEFLGDSILDYYLVSYLFEKYPENDSGKLTIKKSSVANNKALSLASLKNNLDMLIQINSSTFESWALRMKEDLDKYIKNFDEYEKSNDDKHTLDNVKIAADLFEALVGAIYLDSNQDLAKTFELIDYLYKDIMLSLVEQADKRAEPKLLVLEYCRIHGIPDPKPVSKNETDGKIYWELVVQKDIRAKFPQNINDIHHIERKLFEIVWKKIKINRPENQDK